MLNRCRNQSTNLVANGEILAESRSRQRNVHRTPNLARWRSRNSSATVMMAIRLWMRTAVLFVVGAKCFVNWIRRPIHLQSQLLGGSLVDRS